MYNDSAANADLDDFVARAEQINAAVRGLASGTLEPEDTNTLLAELDQTRARADPAAVARREEQRARAEEERKRRGIKGQGARPGYLYFCKRCFLEYDLEPLPPAGVSASVVGSSGAAGANKASDSGGSKAPPKCAHCSSTLETREQRMEELMGKVATLQARKAERAQRRQAYEQWRREKGHGPSTASNVVVAPRIEELKEGDEAASTATAGASRSLSTAYESWTKWEPSSDEEQDVPQPDHPEFAAMRADIEAREARKKVARASSEKSNEAGNAAFKSRDYLGAIDRYSAAIDLTRDDKAFYTNRALAYLHVHDHAAALKDCQTALDLWECFEESQAAGPARARAWEYKNTKVVLKAYLRRARAHLGLGALSAVREGLLSATKLIQQIYSNARGDPALAKAQRDELAEVEKLRKQVEEREEFARQEKQVLEATAASAPATAPPAAADGADADKSAAKRDGSVAAQSSSSVAPAAAAAAVSAVPAASSPDSDKLTALLSALTDAHRAMISSAPVVSPAASSAHASWLAMVPALELLVLSLEGDEFEGNKERVATQVEARLCVEVLIKMLKHRSPSCTTTPAPAGAAPSGAVGAPGALPPLPDFSGVLALLAQGNAAHVSSGVSWRERGGFVILGKYLNQLFGILRESDAAAAPAVVPVPASLLLLACKALMLLTDREHAREHFSSPGHAPVLTDFAVELLSCPVPPAPSSAAAAASAPAVVVALGSPTAVQLEALQLCATNLVANLAFQPRYRQWLCAAATSSEAPSRLERLYAAVLGLARECPLTSGKAGSKTAVSATPAATKGCTVLSAGLTALLNLLTHAGCRSKFIEFSAAAPVASASASASPASPLDALLSALTSLSAAWSGASYRVLAGSAAAELGDKLLSVSLNLCVDDAANALFFARLFSPPTAAAPASASASPALIERLLALAAQPAAESKPDATASATSITSALPPLLVERALGLVTRGLRREHNAASAAPAASSAPASASAPASPIRALVVQHGGPLTAGRILALHRFAATEEAVSAATVLAKLSEPRVDDDAAASAPAAVPSSSAAGSSSPCFRYTRSTLEHSSVLLAICMSHDGAVARSVASLSWQGRGGLSTLVELLSSPHRNVAGNACLCIDALTALPEMLPRPELSAALPLLLEVVKDPAAKAAHQNAAKAAIVIGRAPNNAEQWTKLRGLEIIAARLAPSLLKKK